MGLDMDLPYEAEVAITLVLPVKDNEAVRIPNLDQFEDGNCLLHRDLGESYLAPRDIEGNQWELVSKTFWRLGGKKYEYVQGDTDTLLGWLEGLPGSRVTLDAYALVKQPCIRGVKRKRDWGCYNAVTQC